MPQPTRAGRKQSSKPVHRRSSRTGYSTQLHSSRLDISPASSLGLTRDWAKLDSTQNSLAGQLGLGMEGARMLCKAGGVRRRFHIQTPGGAYIAFFAMCAMRGFQRSAMGLRAEHSCPEVAK